jgi:hypothetical protein
MFREHVYDMSDSVTGISCELVGVPCNATDEFYALNWERGNYDVTADRPTIY